MMKRTVDADLMQWKMSTGRKVLLVRGARQVGKTFCVRSLGGTFSSFLEVNFDLEKPVQRFFQGSLHPATICQKLAAYFDADITPGKTLLFLDEIQACPEALASLRYFHEKMPALHVVAAGSLLEFALSEMPSFGVGRISSLYMYPLSFVEFAEAVGGSGLAETCATADHEHPVDPVFHDKLLEMFRTYLMVGGMPSIVEAYRTSHDLRRCRKELADLISTLQDDFAKYRARVPAVRLQETLRSVAHQTGGKFMYSRVDTDGSRHSAKRALELLTLAGLVHRVYHSSARGIPLGAQIDEGRFKAILLDTGLLLNMLGLDISAIMTDDIESIVNKGSLAEAFVGLQLLATSASDQPPQLFYWHRETPTGNAEVDYVVQRGSRIVPVEVKSGRRGAMQSMHVFLQERNLKKGIRVSQENFGRYGEITIVPLYAAGRVLDPGLTL